MFLKVQQGESVYTFKTRIPWTNLMTLLNGMWNKMSLKLILSGLPSLGTSKEKRKWLSFLFQAICLCLDIGSGLLRSLFTLAINTPPVLEEVLIFKHWNIWFLLLDTDHDDSSPCISAVQSCWFICIPGYMTVQQRALGLGSEGNIAIIISVMGQFHKINNSGVDTTSLLAWFNKWTLEREESSRGRTAAVALKWNPTDKYFPQVTLMFSWAAVIPSPQALSTLCRLLLRTLHPCQTQRILKLKYLDCRAATGPIRISLN